MRSLLKKIVCFAALVCLLLMAGHLYYYVTGDFRPSYLLKSQPVGDQLDLYVESGIVPLKGILGQPYHYLGQGNQTFAFESEDGNYVLKLFKKDYFRRSGWVHIIPPIGPFRPLFLYRGSGKENRKAKLLNGYETGYRYDRENSGLLFYHDHNTNDPQLETTVATGLGFRIPINLNRYVFALQVKAVPTKRELTALLSQGKVSEVKQRLGQIFDLYFYSFDKSIFDNDHNLLDNTGFYGNRAIRQDVGKIVREPALIDEAFVRKEMKKITDERLTPWLQKNYPEYAPDLVGYMREQVDSGLRNYTEN